MAEGKPDRRVMWFWIWFLLGVGLVIAYAVRTLMAPPAPEPGASAPPPAMLGEPPRLEMTIAGEANGKVVIELMPDVAPKHAERLVQLARAGAYDGVVFHRVIDGFMAQTGDVEFGRVGGDMSRAGSGGSDLPDLPAEFSDRKFVAGTVGMARASDPDSANSQFFIMFAPGEFLEGKYTVVGKVVEGMDVVMAIKRGEGGNGAVIGAPDVMTSMRVIDPG